MAARLIPGTGTQKLFAWLLLQGLGVVQLELTRRRLRGSDDPRDVADGAMADALQQGQLIYLLAALFVGIAYQPFALMLIGLQIALVAHVRRRLKPAPVPLSARPLCKLTPVAPKGAA